MDSAIGVRPALLETAFASKRINQSPGGRIPLRVAEETSRTPFNSFTHAPI